MNSDKPYFEKRLSVLFLEDFKQTNFFIMKAFILITLGLLLSVTQTFAQKGVEDESKYGHGEDSITCLKNLSLYSELVKQDRYDDAYPYWEVAFNECPLSTRRLYTDGVKIISHKIKSASCEEKKDVYFQDLMNVYDQRIEYFGDHPKYGVGYIKGIKAIDMLDFKKAVSEIRAEAYQLLNESIEEQGEKSKPAVLGVYMKTTVAMFIAGELNAIDVVNNYTTVSKLLNSQIENPRLTKRKSMLENLNGKIEEIFARSGAANCETLNEIFSPQLEANKDNIEWLQRVSRLLARELCEDMELLYKVSEYQHNIEPSSSSAYGLARMYLKSGDTERAIEFYNEAIKLVENKEQKSEYYYQLGLIYLSQGNYVSARSNALKAIELNANWGQPYIVIGKTYATSANSIGDNDFEHKTAYWAAVDKFSRAKSVDPEVTDEANDLINVYTRHFPAKDEIFFQGLEIGGTYTVGGWIGERTSVRSK
jgi:tetratricopeptide (TPR) repeat protein